MLRVTDDDLDYIAGGRMFITNGTSLCAAPSRESTYLALERARRAGCRVVFDVDYRAMSWPTAAAAGQAIRLALPFIDVLIGNQPELCLVAGEAAGNAAGEALGEDHLERATAMLRERVPLLVSKLGERGTRVWQGRESVFLPPYAVEVVSTIGAGDGFASGFLYALLAGKPVVECLHYGNAAAAIVVSRLSCSEAMPTLAEVEAMVGSQRKEVEHGVCE
jgi:5-dehydro-2-deoxygluconokinase